MPLGFGKSQLTQTSRGYFQSTSNVGSGNHAGVLLDGSTTNAYNNWVRLFVGSFWFNCTSSQLDTGTVGRIIDWQGGSSPNFDQNQFTVFITGTGVSFFWIQNTYGTAAYSVSPTSWSTNYLDGKWHHVAFKLNVSGPVKQFYLDGVSQTMAGTDNSSNTPTFGRYASMFYDTNNNTTYTTTDQYGGKLHYLWLGSSDVDLSADISKFYSSGYVNLGTDGTASGLSQPRLFIYVNQAGVLTNGGSMSNTITVPKEGTGTLTLSNAGGGP